MKRFKDVAICKKCNSKEASMKQKVPSKSSTNIDKYFSYTPDEIEEYIFINPLEPDRIRSKREIAEKIYNKLEKDHLAKKSQILKDIPALLGQNETNKTLM